MKIEMTGARAARSGVWQALAVAWMGVAAVGCSPLAQEQKISACGGFSQQEQSIVVDPATYCDAEMLHWQYDATADKLTLSNTRVQLNCCGERSVTVSEEDDAYVVTVRDAPELLWGLPGMASRCDCLCVFDFTVAVSNMPAGTIHLKLVRDVTDHAGGPTTAWQGDLDLGAGHDSIVIESSADVVCQTTAQ